MSGPTQRGGVMSHGVVELVLFKGTEGVEPSRMTTAAAVVTPFLRAMPGFVSREFSVAADGRYADIVRWRSKEDAEAAARAVTQIAECRDFFSLIEQSSVTFLHLSVVELA